MQIPFTAVFQKSDDWWVAWVEELPGANTQGKTLDEARENLRDAVAMMIAANRERARQDVDDSAVIREPLMFTID